MFLFKILTIYGGMFVKIVFPIRRGSIFVKISALCPATSQSHVPGPTRPVWPQNQSL